MRTAQSNAPEAAPSDLRQRARASRAATARLSANPSETHWRAPHAICAAGRLGEMLVAAWKEWGDVDDATMAENAEALGPLRDHSVRKIADLEIALSFARASSPPGMLAQLAAAYAASDLAVHGSTGVIREASAEQAQRCIQSVAAALCAMTGIDRDGYSAGDYMPARCDWLAPLSPELTR